MKSDAKNPLISVIVPIYNVEKYLNRCIDSLIHQDFDNYEVILVNDCSTDKSLNIAEEYAKENAEKCILVSHKVNGGLAAARNTGMKHASGDWVTFVDSDDWVSSDYLSGLHTVARDNQADVVIGGVLYAYDDGTLKSADSYGNLKNGASNKEIIARCRSYACGRLFKKSLFTNYQIEFPSDIRRSEDIGTIIPILTNAEHIAIFEKDVYFYYQRRSSLSLSNSNLDLSFYPKTIDRMLELSSKGYKCELEFRCIHELLYGMVYLMVVSQKSKSEFVKHIDSFNRAHEGWKKNKYIKYLPKAKQLFIALSGRKQYALLKILVYIKKHISKAGA